MTPQKQTEFSDESNGVHGNCFSACIASMFDMPLSEVPNFSAFGDKWFEVFWEFMKPLPFDFEGTWDISTHPNWFQDFKGIDGFVIVGGTSPRGIKNGHAVIYKDGVPYFDPHPDNTFLGEAKHVNLIVRK